MFIIVEVLHHRRDNILVNHLGGQPSTSYSAKISKYNILRYIITCLNKYFEVIFYHSSILNGCKCRKITLPSVGTPGSGTEE